MYFNHLNHANLNKKRIIIQSRGIEQTLKIEKSKKYVLKEGLEPSTLGS